MPKDPSGFFYCRIPPGLAVLGLVSQITSCHVGTFLVPTKMLQFTGILTGSVQAALPCLHPHLLVNFFSQEQPLVKWHVRKGENDLLVGGRKKKKAICCSQGYFVGLQGTFCAWGRHWVGFAQ